MKRKGQQEIIVGLIAIITLVIGMVIVDDVIRTTNNLNSITNETHTLTAVPENITLSYSPIPLTYTITITNTTGAVTLDATNYTIISRTDSIIQINDNYDNDTQGMELYFSYNYIQAEYFDSALTRTISSFIVPIGLLAIIGFVGYVTLIRKT